MKRKLIILVVVLMSFVPIMAQAENLAVPIIEHANGDSDTCLLGLVLRLKADGDGFLAVRSGPDAGYKKLDELHNEDEIWVFDSKGKWFGILYDIEDPNCRAVEADRAVPYAGKKGWVHRNWVDIVAS